MKRILVALMLLALVILVPQGAMADDWNTYVATPTTLAQGKAPAIGYGTADPTSVTIASSAVTNLCVSLPSNEYHKITFSLTAGTAYLNGSVATPTIGIPLTIGHVHTIDLPAFPKDRGVINVIPAATGTIKVLFYKIRP